MMRNIKLGWSVKNEPQLFLAVTDEANESITKMTKVNEGKFITYTITFEMPTRDWEPTDVDRMQMKAYELIGFKPYYFKGVGLVAMNPTARRSHFEIETNTISKTDITTITFITPCQVSNS